MGQPDIYPFMLKLGFVHEVINRAAQPNLYGTRLRIDGDEGYRG